jgi:hypothetical protein
MRLAIAAQGRNDVTSRNGAPFHDEFLARSLLYNPHRRSRDDRIF